MTRERFAFQLTKMPHFQISRLGKAPLTATTVVWQGPQLINSSCTSSHSLSLSESHPGLPGAEASPCARLSLYVRFLLIWTQLLCSSNQDSENPESFFITSHKGSRRGRRICPDTPSSPPHRAVRNTSGK